MLTPKLKESRAEAVDIEATPMAKAITAERNNFIFYLQSQNTVCEIKKRINLLLVDLMTK
jgi:hypothetical protein